MGIFFRSLKYYSNSVKSKHRPRSIRLYSDKVPKHPHIPHLNKSVKNQHRPIEIDLPTVKYLERLSLVNFGNYEGIEILKSSIKFAENLLHIDTAGVEPLSSVLENRTLSLREDIVTEGNSRNVVMKNAKITEEDYYVAPPGNIPLEAGEIEYKKEKIQKKKVL